MHYVVTFLDTKTNNDYRLDKHIEFLKSAPVQAVTMVFNKAEDYVDKINNAELPMPVTVLQTEEELPEYAWNDALLRSTTRSSVFVLDGSQIPASNDWLHDYILKTTLATGYIKSADSNAGMISQRLFAVIKRRGFWSDPVWRGGNKSSQHAINRVQNLSQVQRFRILEVENSNLKTIRRNSRQPKGTK